MSLQSIQLDEAEMGRHHELYLFSDSFLYFEVASKIENRFTTATNQEIIGFVFYFVEVGLWVSSYGFFWVGYGSTIRNWVETTHLKGRQCFQHRVHLLIHKTTVLVQTLPLTKKEKPE